MLVALSGLPRHDGRQSCHCRPRIIRTEVGTCGRSGVHKRPHVQIAVQPNMPSRRTPAIQMHRAQQGAWALPVFRGGELPFRSGPRVRRSRPNRPSCRRRRWRVRGVGRGADRFYPFDFPAPLPEPTNCYFFPAVTPDCTRGISRILRQIHGRLSVVYGVAPIDSVLTMALDSGIRALI